MADDETTDETVDETVDETPDETVDETSDDSEPDTEAAYVAKIEELSAIIAEKDIQIATLTGQLAGSQQANRDLLALIGTPVDETADDADETDYDTVPDTAIEALYAD